MLNERQLLEVIADQENRLTALKKKPSIKRAIDYQYFARLALYRGHFGHQTQW